ncbi:MAG: branched-chain amino acid transport system substrate-binding protein, partial [Acetobacteraceae bacterium]|nr:branched-chain amino acid transport system substrate-binding protein [Acetobacteraceae bacterium]
MPLRAFVRTGLTHLALAAGLLASSAAGARAGDAAPMPGVTATSIKIGNIAPYSGPVSAYSNIAKAEAAYFAMLNDQGGINGRKVEFISLDDGYSPPRAVEQVRRLVEQDGVALIGGAVGTPSNAAIEPYLNLRKVPDIFNVSGVDRMHQPKTYPWTIGWPPSYRGEARVFAQHILQAEPEAKIALIYQNDDLGKDELQGLKDVLGHAMTSQAATASYEVTDPTVDSQVTTLQASGATVLMIAATPKFAAQIIRKASDIGWKPQIYMSFVASSITGTLVPAGVDRAVGVISSAYLKDPNDPAWRDDPDMAKYREFFGKYLAGSDIGDSFYESGYVIAEVIAYTLRQCGDNLSRDNIMRNALHLDGVG